MKTLKSESAWPASNPILEEVWAARRALSEAAGNDISRIFAGARKRERLSDRPVINLEKTRSRRKPRTNSPASLSPAFLMFNLWPRAVRRSVYAKEESAPIRAIRG